MFKKRPRWKRYYYKDLEANGVGSRWTIDRRVQNKKFPEPLRDEAGRPFWTDELLERHQEELEERGAA